MGSNGEEAVPYLNGEVPVVNGEKPHTNGTYPQVEEFTGDAATTHGGQPIEADVLVIGAGFSGITAIDRFRKAGMSVKCFESGQSFGGVWFWNRYPGARVDSEMPFYQLNIPEVYKTWNFSERFPGHEELRRYMAHLDTVLDLSKDTYFNARVIDARRDETTNLWTIKTQQGHVAKGKYLILATGLLHRAYTPDFPGLSDYKGELYHTGAWPEEFDGKGKKIGLIGAGATAVQVTQELGKQADEMTVFLRRPSYCFAMQQRPLTEVEQRQLKVYYPALFKSGRDSAVGFPSDRVDKGILEVTPEEREKHLNAMWETGGFHFQLSGYNDTALNPEANKVQYDFWRRKVCSRLTDPAKQAIMAPAQPPYYIGTKRSPLEQDYYEVLNQPNIHIHDLSKSPLETFTPDGLRTADGRTHTFDAIVLATGFDSFTGSITRMGLKDKTGTDIRDLWADGVRTYLGITMRGFPNCFMAYTPQAPTALSNGPTIIEAQVETIVDFVRKLEAEGVRSLEPREEAQTEWKEMLDEMSRHTLFPYTDSWWNGSNIPGKKAENMNYIAGINVYEKQCRATMDGWKGFDVVKAN